jgi:hypothetical protein
MSVVTGNTSLVLRDKRYLNASLAFAALTAAFLIIVNYASVQSKIGEALALLAGMTAMGALSYFQRYVERDGKLPTRDITFDEVFLGTSISEAFKVIARQSGISESWSANRGARALTPDQLVGGDNALALARLRIDLEAELRRIAHQSKVAGPDRLYGIAHLINELFTAGVLPAEFLGPLKEVVDVCNRGIHGMEIPDELAASVVRIGNQLLDSLSLLPLREMEPYPKPSAEVS